MKIYLKLIFLSVALCSCSFLNERLGLKDDNDLEEIMEEIIQQKTGAKVDLTPSTREKE